MGGAVWKNLRVVLIGRKGSKENNIENIKKKTELIIIFMNFIKGKLPHIALLLSVSPSTSSKYLNSRFTCSL